MGWLAAGIVAALALSAALAIKGTRHSELYPDVAIVHYRFSSSPTVAPGPDPSATIVALEARGKAPQAHPLDPLEEAELSELYLQRGLLEGDARDFEKAETLAQKSLQRLSWPNSAALTLAKLASARHDFREAIKTARRFLLRKRSVGALSVEVSAYLALGELDRAAEVAEEAVALRPDSSVYLLRALVMQAQGRDSEAAFDFSRAALAEDFSSREESAKLRALWGRFLLRRGEFAGAHLLLDEALRIVPRHPLALDLQGELALREGRFADARQQFQLAFGASKQLRYLMDEARACELAADHSGADALRSQVEHIIRIELDQKIAGHRLELVEVLVDRGRPEDLASAVALAREEVSQRPSADVRFQLARALARSGDTAAALAQVRAVLATGAREAQIYELAADLEAATGNPSRAALYRRLAQKLDPGSSGWRRLGLAVAQAQPLPSAAPDAAAQPDPRDP
jgi:tetratricopeptide (TPR) repeat protein